MRLWNRSENSWSWQGIICLLPLYAVIFLAISCAAQQAAAPAAGLPQVAAAVRQNAPAPPAQAAAPPQQASQSAPPPSPGTESVHIVVGHSLLIHTPSRVKRILTGNPAVIESVVTSPAELVITAKEAGSSSLMLWDESGRSRYLDVYSDLDVTALRASIDQSFPSANVDVQSEGDKVVLVGVVPAKDVADQMLDMAKKFSKEVVDGLRLAAPPRDRQVILKVRFAEADRQKLSQWGFNLFSTGATNTIGSVSTEQFSPFSINQVNSGQSQFTTSDLLNIFLFRPDINLGATIKLLQEKNVLQILAEPDLMAINGQPAHFLAGGEFPYPVVQAVSAGTAPAITIVFKPYGVKLEFTAFISENGTIRMKVSPEVSSLDYSNAVTISGFILPAISTRRAETEIELRDGQSFGMAGLLDHRTTVQLSKVPGIGDIPILGELFKSRNANFTNTELLVLVTPTIVDPVGTGEVPNPPQPQVNFGMQNGVEDRQFDKNLPYTAKPEASK